MGRSFTVEYDDFTGGHFVGANQAQQPKNTWTGNDIVCTSDEGFLMPTAASSLVGGYLASSSEPSPATSFPEAGNASRMMTTQLLDLFYLASGTWNLVVSAFPANVDASASPAVFGGSVYFPSATGSALYGVTTAYVVSTVSTGSAGFNAGVYSWKNWLVGANNNTIWFSAPDAPTSWPTTNFITIGNSSHPILCCVPTQDELLVMTTEAFWSVTGVLGETTTVRKITHHSASALSVTTSGIDASRQYAVNTQAGLLFLGLPNQIALLRGKQITTFATAPNTWFQSIVPYGNHVVAVGGTRDLAMIDQGTLQGAGLWVWNAQTGQWRVHTLPTTTVGSFNFWKVAANTAGGTSSVSVIDQWSVGSGIYQLQARTFELDPVSPSDGTTSNTGTVTLAEHQRNSPFRVKEMLVEVDLASRYTSGAYAAWTAKRSLTAQVLMPSVADLDSRRTAAGEPDPVASSTFTKTFQTGAATKRGQREMVRFSINDGATSAYSVVPKLTLEGVKVRRVILQCEEV
jgi:hypothetical protein